MTDIVAENTFINRMSAEAHDKFSKICVQYSEEICQSIALGYWKIEPVAVTTWVSLGLNELHAAAVLDYGDEFWSIHAENMQVD